MKTSFLLFMLVVAIIAGCSTPSKNSINPADQLTASQKEAVKKSIIRYVIKAPDGAAGNEKFNREHDAYYEERGKACRLEFYTVKDGYNYFLMSQPASSLTEKRNATGGRFALNDKGEMTQYEEVFRTWKMKPEDLKVRSEKLFRDFIAGKSLEKYYAKTAGDEYIEFPDERTYYDKEARTWKLK